MRVLLVEDEVYMARAIGEALKKSGYLVDLAHDGETGSDLAVSGMYDMVILDIMLPNKDGYGILADIRGAGIHVPVLFLTAKGELPDKIAGLDKGADDYLPKPFHMEELLARLRALGRRKPELYEEGTLHFSGTAFDPQTGRIWSEDAGEETAEELTPKESLLLESLIRARGRTLTKDQLIEKVWGWDAEAVENNVETHISLLRKKLARLGADSAVVTVRGAGYRAATEREDGKGSE